VKFGQYLRRLRKKKNLSLRQLSDLTGISDSYLSLIEKGKRGVPRPEYLRRLAEALGVSYDDMLAKAGYREPERREIPLEDALQELLNSDYVVFDGLPMGEIDEEVKEDLKTAFLAIMEYKAKRGEIQNPKKAAAAGGRAGQDSSGDLPLLPAAV